MSNRYFNQGRNGSRSFPKFDNKLSTIKNFQNHSTHQTLSNSLRSSTATDRGVTASDRGVSVDAVSASASTVTMGENWEWVKETSPSGSFVIYLPQDEAVAAGLGPDEGGLDPVESQGVVDLLNRELSRLLKLHPKDFWTEVSIDESLNAFLESFLKFRNRWYDFPYHGPRGIVAGVIVGELELCRRVFMVLYRLSSNRDPGAKATDTLSSKDHIVLLQNKKLLDLPKLLDICAIYGRENEDLTRILVMNAMKAQPHIQDDFPVLISRFLCIVQTMHQQCNSTLEVLLNSGSCREKESNRLCFDYLEVMDFINDAVVSMDLFITSYKQAAIFLSSPVEMSDGNEELLTTLARLHDSLLPCLQKGFHNIFATVDDKDQEISVIVLSNVFVSLKMLSTRIVEFGWKLLHFCYLSDDAFESSCSPLVFMKMFPANVEDPVVRADILIQSLKDLSGDYTHAAEGSSGTFIQNIEKNHQIISRIELLQNSGWISMDDEQFQFLAGIMKHSQEIYDEEKNSTLFQVTGNKILADENAAMVESKIIQIKELFPDYGRGFLEACLEAYNQDAEEVIQRILEGTLHEGLESLDISLERIPPPNSGSSVSKYEKGKEKLVDTISPSGDLVSTSVKNKAGVSSSSSSTSVGRFIRKNTDTLSNFETLNATKDKELVKTAALISQLEYEDEYDDSFDDLGFSVCDSVLEESETLGDGPSSPRGRSMEADGGSSTSNTDNLKWNSRKKPLFYVKDGKNYSYKVADSVAVASYKEAKLVNLAQKELVHGLGRGGNIPLGNIKRLIELNELQEDRQVSHEVGGRGSQGNVRDLGNRSFPLGVGKKHPGSNEEQNKEDTDDTGGRGGRGNTRGGGRRIRGRNHHRRDRSMNKHFSGMPGHFNA